MVEGKATILLVEDDAPQRRMMAGFLQKNGYLVLAAESADAAVKAARGNDVDILLTDLRLGGPDGVVLLERLREASPDVQSIVMTAYGTVEDAVRAMRAGAYDFIMKPVDLERVLVLLDKALEKGGLARENRRLSAMVGESGAFDALIGASPAMQDVRRVAAKVAASRASLLVLGESGTGKEVLARAIHAASPRSDKPFVTLNCAALPESLMETELFGHEKGAFTGAETRRKGRFESADGGTLFLDEVGEIPLSVQVKLLNVIQSGRFERVGGNESIATDARIISATNRDLQDRIVQGQFRQDLFYRLNVVSVTMPALRERSSDIPILVSHFLKKYASWSDRGVRGVADEAMRRLIAYPFPGNVRELENWIERAMVLADGELLTLDDFPAALRGIGGVAEATSAYGDVAGGLDGQVGAFEMKRIAESLAAAGGNQSAAARALGISERTIRYKIRKYGL